LYLSLKLQDLRIVQYIGHKHFPFVSTTLVRNIFRSDKHWESKYRNKPHVHLRVKCPSLFSSFNQKWQRQSLANFSNILFRDNPCCGSRILTCGRINVTIYEYEHMRTITVTIHEHMRTYNRHDT
jgi:hypothetical protein